MNLAGARSLSKAAFDATDVAHQGQMEGASERYEKAAVAHEEAAKGLDSAGDEQQAKDHRVIALQMRRRGQLHASFGPDSRKS